MLNDLRIFDVPPPSGRKSIRNPSYFKISTCWNSLQRSSRNISIQPVQFNQMLCSGSGYASGINNTYCSVKVGIILPFLLIHTLPQLHIIRIQICIGVDSSVLCRKNIPQLYVNYIISRFPAWHRGKSESLNVFSKCQTPWYNNAFNHTPWILFRIIISRVDDVIHIYCSIDAWSSRPDDNNHEIPLMLHVILYPKLISLQNVNRIWQLSNCNVRHYIIASVYICSF